MANEEFGSLTPNQSPAEPNFTDGGFREVSATEAEAPGTTRTAHVPSAALPPLEVQQWETDGGGSWAEA